MKRTPLMKRAIAIGIVGAMAFCETVPSFAAPVVSSTALLKTTAPDVIDQVRVYRRGGAYRHGGGAVGAAAALGMFGAVAGAIAQSQYNYGPGYYGPGPGYYGPGPGYYAPVPGYYGPGPGYYAPGPGYYSGPGYYPPL